MRLANETITVFNKRANTDGGYTWNPTTITGASWYESDAQTVDPQGGFVAAGKITIRIPTNADAGGKTYADPLTYRNAADVSALWTLEGGCVIVRGAVTGNTWTPKTLAAAYAGICTVMAVTDNRRAPREPHFKVVGV